MKIGLGSSYRAYIYIYLWWWWNCSSFTQTDWNKTKNIILVLDYVTVQKWEPKKKYRAVAIGMVAAVAATTKGYRHNKNIQKDENRRKIFHIHTNHFDSHFPIYFLWNYKQAKLYCLFGISCVIYCVTIVAVDAGLLFPPWLLPMLPLFFRCCAPLPRQDERWFFDIGLAMGWMIWGEKFAKKTASGEKIHT